MRDGQAIDINDPQMTLTGKRGTLVARNRIELVDLPDGWAVFTGTWKVIRGTGDYAGLSGGGRGAGVMLRQRQREVAVRRLSQPEMNSRSGPVSRAPHQAYTKENACGPWRLCASHLPGRDRVVPHVQPPIG